MWQEIPILVSDFLVQTETIADGAYGVKTGGACSSVFAVHLGWLPTSGRGGWLHLVLPAVTLSCYSMASLTRLMRSSVLEVLGSDYIRTAQSKGLRERAVVIRHMVRNALIPVVTILGPILAFLVTGSFIIETIFTIPGVGRYYITAIGTRDYGLLMAMTMLYAFAVAFMNVVVDVLYAYIDPRIRYS